MTTRTNGIAPRVYARIIGALYLLIFFVGPFTFFMGRTSVVVPGDPAATVESLAGFRDEVPARHGGRNGDCPG